MRTGQAAAIALEEEAGGVSEFARIQEAALAASKRPYPATAAGQALYWDEVLTSFIRAHGAELAAEVFGIEVQTARKLLYLSLFPPRTPCTIVWSAR
jgi:hypothetical protein